VDPDLLAGVFKLLKARVKKGLDIASGAAFPQPDRTSVDDVVFAYAAGKPFVYCSRYQPSPRVFGLARTHGVQLVWSPLHEIPPALLERHGTWRLLWLSESQSECLAERLATAKTDRPAACVA